MDLTQLRKEIIGSFTTFKTPYGNRLMTYADYTASGRNLKFIEKYIMQIEEMYANTHTEDNNTGHKMTLLYHDAKNQIRSLLGGTDDYAVITTGSGATGAIQQLTQILGIYEAPATKAYYMDLITSMSKESKDNAEAFKKFSNANKTNRPVIFNTSYEHHSNVLTWREGNCDVVEVELTAEGIIDIEDLKEKVSGPSYLRRLKIGAFSAASNVTGMTSPIWELVEIMHSNNGFIFIDYSASAPYVPIAVYKDELNFIDGIYFSPHKFIGGPGAAGILIIHKRIYNSDLAPTCAGGGTVEYVSSTTYDFKKDIEAREDAGTPAILQTIRAALALKIKAHIGYDKIEQIENNYIEQALKLLFKNPSIELVGFPSLKNRLSIFSFNIRYKHGLLHPRFVTKLLNDLFGIQARAGCSCAGPYGHRLLGIDENKSLQYRKVILEGYEAMKPGWVRVNFHYLFDENTFNFILDAILFTAEYGYLFLEDYEVNPFTGLWTNKESKDKNESVSLEEAMKSTFDLGTYNPKRALMLYKDYLMYANELAIKKKENVKDYRLFMEEKWPDLAWFWG